MPLLVPEPVLAFLMLPFFLRRPFLTLLPLLEPSDLLSRPRRELSHVTEPIDPSLLARLSHAHDARR